MNDESLFRDNLSSPPNAVTYQISQQLAGLFPELAMIEGRACSLDLLGFAAGGYCSVVPKSTVHNQISTEWEGAGKGLEVEARNAWFEVKWGESRLEVVIVTLKFAFCEEEFCWILGPEQEIIERFYETVCEWSAEVRDEILVFDGGGWQKSEALFKAIKSATYDSLVLHGQLKQMIRDDIERFFDSQETYRQYGVPWKRGVVLIGPPGNGKTHTVKAIVNATGKPCLYVKSFKSEHGTDHDNIRGVFARARESAPCILVLEDLDSLVDEENRAFFLNELDGFAENIGILTLATTNHPEKLDRSILDRPSRFDRKYHFELPQAAERLTYIEMWNQSLQAELRLSSTAAQQLADSADGFSFAYLKELFLASIMRWVNDPQPGTMQKVATEQLSALRDQMTSEDKSVGKFDGWMARRLHSLRIAVERAEPSLRR